MGYGGPRAQRFARRLTRRLRREGHHVFFAAPGSGSMIGGLNLSKRITRALADADVLVMVCTRATIHSRPAMSEIRLAREMDTVVVPFVEMGAPTPQAVRRENAWCIRFSGEDPNAGFPDVLATLGQLGPIIENAKRIRREAYQP